MNKIQGYDVVITKGTPRFRLDNRLIKGELVPVDVKAELLAQALDKDAPRVVAPAPDAEATYTEQQPTTAPVELPDDTQEGDNPYIENPEAFVPEQGISAGEMQTIGYSQPVAAPEFSELELQLLEENDRLKREMAELDVILAPNPTANNLGIELIERFGIYTALSNREPQVGDIHPFTLKPMNRYDTGLAYAERKKSVGVEVAPAVAIPEPQENAPDNGGFPSFATRTGVSFKQNQSSSILQHHTNDPINEEATAEPNLRGVTIRPHW